MTTEVSMNPSNFQINQLKIAVLAGGIGDERDISIQSGKYIAESIKQTGATVITADITPQNMDVLDNTDIDVFFIALHGKFGEDGQLQQILEDKSLTYTGSGPKASELAFDKTAAKNAFENAGVKTPPAIQFDQNTDLNQLGEKLLNFAQKYVIKPQKQGSSVGITITEDIKYAIEAAQQTQKQFGDCIIEKFIPGREITVGIIVRQTLPIIEIKTKTPFYDYHAKYLDDQTEYLFDTIKDPDTISKINSAALDCFDALRCRGFARVDFILADDNTPYCLEVNTIPGFTSHSLLPKAAENAGISMSSLCEKIIQTAVQTKKLNPVP
jgi:D-alanine-D-alanine ligase